MKVEMLFKLVIPIIETLKINDLQMLNTISTRIRPVLELQLHVEL